MTDRSASLWNFVERRGHLGRPAPRTAAQVFMEALLTAMEEPVIACGSEGDALHFNTAAQRLFGSPPPGATRDRWAELLHLFAVDCRTPLPLADNPLLRALDGEQVDDVRVCIRPPGSLPRHFDCHGRQLRLPGGALLGALIVMHTAEEEVRPLARRLAGLLEATSDIAALLDPDGRIVYLNRSGTTSLRAPAGAPLESCHLGELLDPVSAERLVLVALPTARREGAWQGEITLRTHAGDRTFSQVLLAHLGPDGEVLHFSTLLRDITHFKTTEHALRQARERLAVTQRMAHVGNWEWDLDSGQLWWSEEIHSIFGVARDEHGPTYERFVKSIHPEDRAAVQCAVEAALAGEPYAIDHRIVRPEGGERIVHEEGEVVFDHDGRPMRMTGTVQDVTASREAERAQERLIAILEATPDFVASADLDGRINYLSRGARRLVGMSPDAPLDSLQPAGVAFHPTWAARKVLDEGIPTALREGVWQGESALLGEDGREIPVVQVILAHRGPDGAVEYLSTIARDISEQKRLEESLRRQASTDPLTGAYNRRRFQEFLAEEVKQADRYDNRLALAMFDIDRFKLVNDSFGHAVGDDVLREMVRISGEHIRGVDILARWGGEEFMIMTPETGVDGALRLAEKIRSVVAAHAFEPAGHVTVSFGVTEYRQGEGAAALLARADEALYLAKERGRNRVEVILPPPE